jgi:hypothetical protein
MRFFAPLELKYTKIRKQGCRGAEGQRCGGVKEMERIDMERMDRVAIKNHKDLRVYQMAFDAAMKIFEVSKRFPVEERYSLTDQIRRSSRSVCANLAEAWSEIAGEQGRWGAEEKKL